MIKEANNVPDQEAIRGHFVQGSAHICWLFRIPLLNRWFSMKVCGKPKNATSPDSLDAWLKRTIRSLWPENLTWKAEEQIKCSELHWKPLPGYWYGLD